MKRSILIEGQGDELVISKATEVDVPKKVLELVELEDKTWRLTYSKNLWADLTKVLGFSLSSANKTAYLRISGVGAQDKPLTLVRMNGELKMIEISENHSGGWRVLYHQDIMPDIAIVRGFRIIRED